ncbi:hypothetical protein WICMUC_001320 [Wickerhamomyces mucosus]|uniref:Amino acid permease/ SLC12A domain-containing protein n=1 Tax=Wickerhamomyces mucosus TaxID=1378264 RepID=A0A9P8PVJ9_9ASCO|nr:hypothetical protein WICMUC_001320 [Wickerhamomyces mucosus]
MGLFNRSKSNQEKTYTDVDIESKSLSSNLQTSSESFDETGVKRGLKNRHISLIALSGIIGPGILIGAGITLKNGGPLSLLLSVIVIALVSLSVMNSLGEMLSIYPLGFVSISKKFHSSSLAAAIGYNYLIVWFCVLANEYNTLSSIFTLWDPDNKVPSYGYILLFFALFQAFQLLGVNAFGEAEYWLAWIKIIGLVAYYIFSIVYISGGIPNRPAIGFHYWKQNATIGGFGGFLKNLVYMSTFYSGIESISATSNETKNPSIAIPKAIKLTIVRIIFIYFFIALFYGVTVSPLDERLISDSKSLKAPIAIAIQNAGWNQGIQLVNAFILVTCLSAVNSSIYIGSRTLLTLSHEGLAPKFIQLKDKRGVPFIAITIVNLLGLISIMNVKTGAQDAFGYIINISGVAVFIVWAIISYIHLRIRKSWKVQGFELENLPYISKLFPWFTIFGLFFNILFLLIQGWSVFKPFDVKDFVDCYVLVPFTILLYIFIGFIKGFKIAKVDEIDLHQGIREDLEKNPKRPKWYNSWF